MIRLYDPKKPRKVFTYGETIDEALNKLYDYSRKQLEDGKKLKFEVNGVYMGSIRVVKEFYELSYRYLTLVGEEGERKVRRWRKK